MYKITVRGHFSAAHFLEDYQGWCGSIHGHRWEVVLTVSASQNLETQMIYDFHDLKDTLNSIMNELDHSFIIDPNGNSASRDFYLLAKKYDMRVFEFSGRTTAENLAHYIWMELQRRTGWTTHVIEVFEAPGNSVSYCQK